MDSRATVNAAISVGSSTMRLNILYVDYNLGHLVIGRSEFLILRKKRSNLCVAQYQILVKNLVT